MESSTLDRVTVINLTVFVEALILLSATVGTRFGNLDLIRLLQFQPESFLVGVLAGLALALSSLLIMWLGRFVPALSRLRELIVKQIAPIFARLTFIDILVISAISGFCEEVFFRGVLQQTIGIIWASILFGICHCPSFKHLSYALWAVAAGFFLGWLLIYTNNLWAPACAHAISNAVALLIIRYGIKPQTTQDTSKKE